MRKQKRKTAALTVSPSTLASLMHLSRATEFPKDHHWLADAILEAYCTLALRRGQITLPIRLAEAEQV